jgi:transcriptional regulator of heat shock response
MLLRPREIPMDTEITNRQARILAAIVKENCETGQPVASNDLMEKYELGVSPATIRNEMARLEDLGYIHQPHTSAGRVPTDTGFRYFLNQLMDKFKLSLKEQEMLKRELMKLQMAHVEMGRRIAKLLSEHSQQASFALFPEDVSTVGISNILANPQLPPEDAKEIAEFFDHIDEYADGMIKEYGEKGPEARIGKEITLSKKSDYSMVVTGLRLPSGKKGVIGLIGPKSMKYEKNLSLMEYIAKLLGGGSTGILLIALMR